MNEAKIASRLVAIAKSLIADGDAETSYSVQSLSVSAKETQATEEDEAGEFTVTVSGSFLSDADKSMMADDIANFEINFADILNKSVFEGKLSSVPDFDFVRHNCTSTDDRKCVHDFTSVATGVDDEVVSEMSDYTEMDISVMKNSEYNQKHNA